MIVREEFSGLKLTKSMLRELYSMQYEYDKVGKDHMLVEINRLSALRDEEVDKRIRKCNAFMNKILVSKKPARRVFYSKLGGYNMYVNPRGLDDNMVTPIIMAYKFKFGINIKDVADNFVILNKSRAKAVSKIINEHPRLFSDNDRQKDLILEVLDSIKDYTVFVNELRGRRQNIQDAIIPYYKILTSEEICLSK